jgi:protein involved in polysaccharide export with SLBB domain
LACCLTVPMAAIHGSAAEARSPALPTAGAAGADAATLTMETLDDTHKLGVGDRISFRIKEDDEPAVLVMVTDAGEIEVPYLGRLPAKDKTCRQFAREVKTLLDQSYYYDCNVLISPDVIVPRSAGEVTVTGAVGRPGVLQIPPNVALTVSRAILSSGGFAQFANRKRVRVYRKAPEGGEAILFTIDVSEILDKGRTERDIELQPDDMVVVSERLLNF